MLVRANGVVCDPRENTASFSRSILDAGRLAIVGGGGVGGGLETFISSSVQGRTGVWHGGVAVARRAFARQFLGGEVYVRVAPYSVGVPCFHGGLDDQCCTRSHVSDNHGSQFVGTTYVLGSFEHAWSETR